MMEFSITGLVETDREDVIDIFNHYVEHSFAAYPESKLPYEGYDIFKKLFYGYPTAAARDFGGRLLGFGFLRAHHPAPTFSKVAEIVYFLKPEATSKGIGTAILSRLLDQGRQRGLTSILANIASLNDPSLRFHKKHGFAECGRFRGICTKRGKTFDIVWMQKML